MRRLALSLGALWLASCNSILGNKELPLAAAGTSSDTSAGSGGSAQHQGGSSAGANAGGITQQHNSSGSGGAGQTDAGAGQGEGAMAGASGVMAGGASGSPGGGGASGLLGGGGAKAGAGGTGGSSPACSPACVTGATCESGSCVCATGTSMCPDACADLQTDKNNCGRCGKACASGCSAGRCLTIVTSSTAGDNLYIAVNATDVYYTMRDAGTVSRVSRSGGTPRVLAASQNRPMGIAIDAANIYWVNQGVGFQGQVMKQSLGGGSPVILASGELYPQGIAVDASNVYWTNFAGTASATVAKVPINGTDADKVVLASGALMSNTQDLVIDGTYAYFANYGDGANTGNVMKVPLAGGVAPTVLAGNLDGPTAVAVHGSTLFFLLSGLTAAPTVQKVSVNGGATTPVATLQAQQIAVDDSGIYLTGTGTGRSDLVVLPLNGGNAITLASGESAPTALVLDSSNVFWATGIHSSIKFTSKTP